MHSGVDIHELVSYAGWGVGVCGLLIIALAMLQLNHNLTPFPTPKENGILIQSGLYKFVRHPIYSGIIVGAIGFGFALGSGWKIGIGAALWLLFFVKSTYEEKLLVTQYADYEAYQKRTGRFFPFL